MTAVAPIEPERDDEDADDRWTPPELFEALDAAFRFTVDAAASDENHKLPRYWTVADDGLAQPWGGERVFCNPPYSTIRPWVQKALRERVLGCEVAVLLLPGTRTEQPWWQDLIEPVRDRGLGVETRFLRGRPAFGSPRWGERGPGRARFGCVVVVVRPLGGAR